MKKIAITVIAVLALFSLSAYAEDIGTVEIPRSVIAAEQPLSAGTYTVALTDSEIGTMIQLKQNGEVVASDLAVYEKADNNYETARITYQQLLQDDSKSPIGRVYASYKGKIYYFYLEKR